MNATTDPWPTAPDGYDEQATGDFRVLTKFDDYADVVTIRIERCSASGRPLYETLQLSSAEADALLIGLMNEVG